MFIEFNENHLREITENSDRSKSNSERISDLEDDVKAIKEENKAIHDIATSVKVLMEADISYRVRFSSLRDLISSSTSSSLWLLLLLRSEVSVISLRWFSLNSIDITPPYLSDFLSVQAQPVQDKLQFPFHQLSNQFQQV